MPSFTATPPFVIPADAGTQPKAPPQLPEKPNHPFVPHPPSGHSRTAHLTPPLRKAKGTRAQHAGDARTSPQSTPPRQPASPVSREPSPPPPPRGRLRGGPRVRATRRPRGPTTQTTIPITATTCPPPLRSAKGDASAASRGMPVIHRNTPHVLTPATSFPRTREPSEKQSTPFPPPHPKNTQSSACFPICTPIQNKALYQHIYGTSQLYFPLLLDTYPDVVLAFSLYKLVSDRRIWTPIKPRFDEGIKELR